MGMVDVDESEGEMREGQIELVEVNLGKFELGQHLVCAGSCY